jgi:hypothetical protein
MSLPKIAYPTYNIKIPSLNKNVKFRPFLVKEEKLLLMAKESEKYSDIFSAIKQIVEICCLDNKFDMNKLSLFDMEYIFLKLRSFSVENIVKVSYTDLEDNKNYDFAIDLNEVEVVYPTKIENNIKISDTVGIIMKYPPSSIYEDKEFLELDKDYLFELIIRCVDKIYEGDSIFEAKDYTKKEIGEFLEGLSSKTFNAIQEFLTNSPKLEYVIKYKNSLGNERVITLNSLNDFFTFR